ncbi:MAG TPA: hypothetical protein VL326_00500 [Kofleriaceae bacterium]|nr:hypothetical protein [Kofleriaceae bacterium]
MKVAISALVCALAGTALADPTAEQAARQRAEQLEKAARDSGNPEKYVAAGTSYLELYNANPSSTDGDELLYNAAVAFEEGHAVAGATQAFALLEKFYPNSKITARATARLARLYGDIAMYDKAAEKLEQYAKKYAGEKDALDAISDAAYYRKAIGDRDKAIADTQYFIKTFGAKRPKDAADAMWSLTSLYDSDPNAQLAHLRDYIHTFGSKGGADRLVIAHAKMGELLWKQSCPATMHDGLCVKSNESANKTCGKGTTHTLVPIKRDERKLKEALQEFMAASKDFEKAGDDPAARYYFAQGKIAEADVEMESFLGLGLPKNLDFDPANKTKHELSLKRLDEWTRLKTKSAETANKKYEAVFAIKDAATSITAAERFGLLTLSFQSALVTGEIPRDVKRGPKAADKIKAYCDAMTTLAEPLEEKSMQAFWVCLAKSTELSWFDESSRVCERELARMRPDEFPIPKELRADATNVAPVTASEPPPTYVELP